MQVEKNCVVNFHYRLTNEPGDLIEDSHTHEPMTYLHGHGNIIPGLEREIAGHIAGDQFSVTIAPADAYGLRRADAVQRIPMKSVMTRGKLTPGMMVAVNTEHGPRHVQVIKPGKFTVDVDTNHPLAGVTLTFAVEIIDVRTATEEERAHGHAHGAGGHHH